MNSAKRRESGHLYEFGAFRLDPIERVFARDGRRISLAPKAFDTLLILVQNSGCVLTKDQLIKTLWPDSFVEENNLTQHISALRRVLGEEPGEYIETVPKLGYRFVCRVREIEKGLRPAGMDEGEVIVSKRTRTRVVLREEQEEEVEDGPVPANPKRIETGKALFTRAAWVLMATALGAMVAWSMLRLRSPNPSNAAINLVRLTSDTGLTMSPALSPDGRLVAYASDRGGKGNLEIWVQPISGGPALRLTEDPKDNYSPNFSPDGRTIAYRSEREGGGIYIVSLHGGAPRLVAPYGRRPKFSPDGKWIAYWVGEETGDNTGYFMVPGGGKVYVVPSSGGVPEAIRPEFAAAGYPIWTPDGKHLLFLGNRDAKVYDEATTDWWVAAIDSGAVVGTGASAAFKRMGFASASQCPETWTEDGAAVLMSATFADTRNIWRVPISTKGWKIAGTPERLTFGTDTEMQPSIAGSRLAFASLNGKLEVWSLPIESTRAEPSGVLQRLTDNAYGHGYPAVSPDGTKVAFSLQRGGDREIWLKDLRTAKETAVSRPPSPAFNPNFSPDGNVLLYRTSEDRTSVAYAVSLLDGRMEPICEDCSDYGWSSDRRKLVLVGTSPAGLSTLDIATKRRTALLNHPEYRLWNARFSPDDRWVSLNATGRGRSRIFVVPLRDGDLVSEQDWISIADSGWDDKPRWSPDGSILYFVSERDGFRCIWAQRLDSQKHPVGEAVPVLHAHESGRSLSSIGPGDLSISVARDKIVFNMSERSGNLWLTRLESGR